MPVEIKDASGKITTLEYYQDSRPAQRTANRDRIQYYYHPLGVLEKYQPVNDTTGNGEALTYSYYIFTGFVKTRADVGFEYNLLGNKSKTTDPFGLSTNYQYNNLNRLTTVTADGKNFTYEYYGDGMVKAVNYPQLTGGTSIRTEYTYDNSNRLKTMHNKLGGQTITQYSYNYDNNGNITSVTENGQTTSYIYDVLNRLTGVQRPGGEQLSYQYDSRGNRTTASPNDSGLDGFIPGDFSYSNWDQLATFTTGGQTSNYSYDPEGLRTKKVTPSGTTRYHYDNTGRVITESNAGGYVTAQTIWGNQALARKVGGSYYYYLYNGHGDVTKVIDQNGNIVNSYTYDEWGNILSQQEQLPQPLKYAGEYYDDESGLYYLRARYYDPTVGRFISRDSNEGSITNPLSLNLYVYCYSNPLNYLDPTGHSAKEVWQDLKLGVGAVLNGDNWQSSWAAVKTTPEGAIIYVREGLVGPENYDELTNEDLSWADAKAGASAAAYFFAGRVKTFKVAAEAKIVSKIGDNSALVKEAAKMGANERVQQEADHLIQELAQGNTNPGLGSKNLFKDISYLRGKNGARVFYRTVDGQIEILAKSSKANEQKVLDILKKMYNK
ncbi:tRNA nuclease WapA precursor [Sporotomaculum syntrophicum]|uniref:tRNA nuclease WapA n=1 Tax=Sporotomaculum syntrophicum TaxID=182264 RepID=A0A9D3AWU9_9FIRM|nr:tRNA nuclease WapA precursor [Sporotomaculum syntrophicum]